MRITLQGLQPGTDHAIQVRAVSNDATSAWSRRFLFTTLTDEDNPSVPTGLSATAVGNAFQFEWNAVTTTENNQDSAVVRYELELVANGLTRIISVPQKTDGTKVSYSLSFEENASLFGSAQASIVARVRAVDNKDLKSDYTSTVTTSNAPPAPVTNLTATGGMNSVSLKWTQSPDADVIHYRVFVGSTSGFTPSDANEVFRGNSTAFTYPTTTYSLQYFKVRAYDIFNQPSTDASASATPTSPFVSDTTAPAIPTGLSAPITNNASGIGAIAQAVWTMTSPPSDLAGFNVRWRKVGDTNYQQTSVDKDTRALAIELANAYTNYEFQIRAYDWSANYSNWSTTVTSTSPANAAPSNVTGATMTAGRESITVGWTPVSNADVVSYVIEVAEDSGFTTGLLTYNSAANPLTVSGLKQNQAYHARVKAKDSGGLLSAAWSNVPTATTGTFSASDGLAPTGTPTVTVVGGLGYLLASWTTVTNPDPVTYEVFMSTTSGFTTYNATTKVGEISGSALFIENTATGTPVAYGTTYYVKVRPRDIDGVGSVSAQASGAPVKVSSADSNLTAGDVGAPTTTEFNNLVTSANGKNKIVHSTSPASGTTGYVAGDTWFQYNAQDRVIAQWRYSGSAWVSESLHSDVIANLDAGKITANSTFTQNLIVKSKFTLGDAVTPGVIESYNYTGTTGFSLSSSGLIIHDGIVDAKAIKANSSLITNMYVGSGGSIESSNYQAGTAGFRISNQGIELNDTNSNVRAESFSGGTMTSTTINIGAGGALNVDATGVIKSNNYAAGATGYQLSASGLEINQGSVKADAFSGGTFNAGVINMGAGGSITGGSWTLNSSGLTIPNGGIAAAKLTLQYGQNLIHPAYADFEFNKDYYTLNPGRAITIAQGGVLFDINTLAVNANNAKFNTASLGTVFTSATAPIIYLGKSVTDYNLILEAGKTYIYSAYFWCKGAAATNVQFKVKYSNGTIATIATSNLPANMTVANAQRLSGSLTVPAGVTGAVLLVESSSINVTNAGWNMDGVQVEEKMSNSTTPSSWTPPGGTFIDGGMFKTGSMRSTAYSRVWDATTEGYIEDTNRPAWLVNAEGAAEFNDMSVRGRVIVGAAMDPFAASSTIASGNYMPGEQGWQIRGDGVAEFRLTESSAVSATSITAGTLSADISITTDSKGKIEAFGEDGASVRLDGGGFTVFGQQGTNETPPPLIIFPTNGEPNIISGTLQAAILTVSEGADFQGISTINSSGKLVIAGKMAEPRSPLTYNLYNKERSWLTYSIPSTVLCTAIMDNGAYLRFSVTSAGPKLEKFGAVLLEKQQEQVYPALNLFANDTYTFTMVNINTHDRIFIMNDIGDMAVFDAGTMNYVGMYYVNYGGTQNNFAIGRDYLDINRILVMNGTTGGANKAIRSWALTGGLPVSTLSTRNIGDMPLLTTLQNSDGNTYNRPAIFQRGDFDLGAPKYVIKTKNVGAGTSDLHNQFNFWSDAGIAETGSAFRKVTTDPTLGGGWNLLNAKFEEMNSNKIIEFAGDDSKLMFGAETWTFAYTYADGSYETPIGSETSFEMIRRRYLSLTAPSLPTGVTSAKLYKKDAVSGNFFHRGTFTPTVNTLVYNGASIIGNQAPTVNTFPNANPGEIVSATGNSYWLGDDTAKFYKLIVDSNDDASRAAGNRPALLVGNPVGGHLRIDGNEIISMNNDTTLGPFGMQGKFFTEWNMGSDVINTNGAGNASISHGFEAAPDVVIITLNVADSSMGPRTVNVYAKGATIFSFNIKNANGTNVTSQCIPISWIAYRY